MAEIMRDPDSGFERPMPAPDQAIYEEYIRNFLDKTIEPTDTHEERFLNNCIQDLMAAAGYRIAVLVGREVWLFKPTQWNRLCAITADYTWKMHHNKSLPWLTIIEPLYT